MYVLYIYTHIYVHIYIYNIYIYICICILTDLLSYLQANIYQFPYFAWIYFTVGEVLTNLRGNGTALVNVLLMKWCV